VIANQAGAVQPLNIPAGTWEFPRVSPEGGRIALGTSGADQNIWIYDLAGAAPPRRLTFQGHNRFPIWSADGRRIAFQSDRDGDLGIFWQLADGTGTAERLTMGDNESSHIPEAWSPRGDAFLFSVVQGRNKALWRFSMQSRTAEPFGNITAGPDRQIAPEFSPDARWVIYSWDAGCRSSDACSSTVASGIYMQPFPATGTTYQVATGYHPYWWRDGKSIVYVQGFGRLASVDVVTQPDVKFSAPVPMPRGFNEKLAPTFVKNYDVTADDRFIGLAVAGQGPGAVQGNQINVVLNWPGVLSPAARTN
jgi:dipeptidyl aminopeptidase/acylaminoacyl peptidase